MNIVIDGIPHKLVKIEEFDTFIKYAVYRADTLIGYITKSGAEILYTARDTKYNNIAIADTLRKTVELMILNMFYAHTFKGDKYIKTLGAWLEGTVIQVDYAPKEYIKHVKRVVRYSKAAGDLYIVLDNNKYFYHEFN